MSAIVESGYRKEETFQGTPWRLAIWSDVRSAFFFRLCLASLASRTRLTTVAELRARLLPAAARERLDLGVLACKAAFAELQTLSPDSTDRTSH